jgi:hypothetical protein
MTTSILVIDDLRNFRDGRDAEYARTSAEGLDILEKNAPLDELWLDHDLGMLESGRPDTIMPVIDYLAGLAFDGRPYPVKRVVVHTSNPVGARQMVQSLQNYGYNVTRVDAMVYFIVED